MTREEAIEGIKEIINEKEATNEVFEKFKKIMTSDIKNMIEVIAFIDQYFRQSHEFQIATELHIRAMTEATIAGQTYKEQFYDIVKNYKEAYLRKCEAYNKQNLGRNLGA